ncbi:MAG: hypothetical protein PHN75_06995 [Syntrophales bacterium]|nr:hypothetical protein [Syntrophales bacterium]
MLPSHVMERLSDGQRNMLFDLDYQEALLTKPFEDLAREFRDLKRAIQAVLKEYSAALSQ